MNDFYQALAEIAQRVANEESITIERVRFYWVDLSTAERADKRIQSVEIEASKQRVRGK